MESSLQPKLRMIIDIYANSKFTVKVTGEEGSELLALGGVKYAENWLMDRLHKRNQMREIGEDRILDLQKGEQVCDKNGESVIRVNKSEAVNLYLESLSKIKSRLKAIGNCENEEQEFIINKDILDNL